MAETPNIHIDTIRASFFKNRVTKKHHTKIGLLKSIAKNHGLKWRKMQDTKEIKIAGRYEFRGLKIINIYELEDLSIFYATTKSLNSCDKKAIIEFYGLRQYHKPAPPLDLIAELLDAINNVSSIDLCYDSHTPFNLDAFKIIKYGSTAYVKAEFGTLQRIYFYDKALKNDLSFSLYRAEATAPIIDLNKPALLPKTERLELQLHQAVSDFKDILKLATSSPNNR
ncbi:hypothetical protein CAMGR0001_2088 [Campylobacter gracilis RM3268]|uniref:Uncharacterized protein n=1 Tax=Campylobacter gracilis RM3268 TaxID=553220 RepID=C8PLS7_9BACT|nr:hypothetical protein CAMGR0001_2088 [Campylobacter gracilis RM3268]